MKSAISCCVHLLIGAHVLAPSQAIAGIGSMQCTAQIDYSTSGRLTGNRRIWHSEVRLDCDRAVQDQHFTVPTRRPFLIGLTLCETPCNIEDQKTQIDLPLQTLSLNSDARSVVVRFKTPTVPKNIESIMVGIWPLSALAPCTDERDGCQRFGYFVDVVPFATYEFEDANCRNEVCPQQVILGPDGRRVQP